MSNIFKNIANSICEGIEEAKVEAQRKAAEKAEYMGRLNAAYKAIDPIVDEGVRRGYIKKKDVAFRFCPELKSEMNRLALDSFNRSMNTTTRKEETIDTECMNPVALQYSSLMNLDFGTVVQACNALSGLGFEEVTCTCDNAVYKNRLNGVIATVKKNNRYRYIIRF